MDYEPLPFDRVEDEKTEQAFKFLHKQRAMNLRSHDPFFHETRIAKLELESKTASEIQSIMEAMGFEWDWDRQKWIVTDHEKMYKWRRGE